MSDVLTIWSNVKFPADVMDRIKQGLKPHRFIESSSPSNLTVGPADPLLEQADIAIGQPDPQQAMRLPKLRWIQLTWAGYTRYDTKEFRDAMNRNGTIVCNASSVYSEPCAQHVLSMMLAQARRLPQAADNQRQSHGWPYHPLREKSRLLNGQTALLIGYGAIARRLAQFLTPFDMQLIGFRRHPKNDEPRVKMVSIREIDAYLPAADHVINMLPASAETDQFFNAERFAKLKQDAVYYNVGRGTTNDESALAASLRAGQFAAAYIDAFAEEPLPPTHPLWTTPNCFITPHTAGGHETEFESHANLILNNLKRFESGQELIDRIM